MTKSGIKVTVDTDGCNTSVTNLDGKLIEVKDTYDSYWFKNGWRVKVTATAHEGKTFDGWYINGKKVSSSSTYTHTVDGEVTLVAKATTNNYTITCNLDGGNVNGQTSWSQAYTINDTVTLPTPKKTGYTLTGWVDDATGTQYEVGYKVPKGSTGNKTFTAKYRKNVLRIKYNANSGQVQPTSGNFTQDSKGNILKNGEIYVQTLAYGDTATLEMWNYKNGINIYKDFYRASMTKEWYADIDGQRKYFSQGIVYSPDKFTDISNGDATVTVYVNWTETELLVRLWSDGGTKWQDEKTNKFLSIPTDRYFKTVELISTGMTPDYVLGDPLRLSGKDYHTVKDRQIWYYTDSNGKEIALDVGGTSAVTTKSIATKLGVLEQLKRDRVFVDLHPKWRKNTVTIQYNTNGGKLVSPTNAKYSLDSNGNILRSGSLSVQVASHGELLIPDQTNNGFYDWNNQNGTGFVIQYDYKSKMAKKDAEWNTKPDGTGTSFNDHIGYTADDVADLKDGDKTLKVYVNWVDSYILDVNALVNGTQLVEVPANYVRFSLKITTSDGKVSNYTNISDWCGGEYKPFTYELTDIEGRYEYKYVGDKTTVSGRVENTGRTEVNLPVSKVSQNVIQHNIMGVKQEDATVTSYNKPRRTVHEEVFSSGYGETFTFWSDNVLEKIPEGIKFNAGSYVHNDTNYIFGMNFTQKDKAETFEYRYSPVEYKITYNMGSNAVNHKDNPATYNVLYGVTLKEPTRQGYKFEGWYANGKKVTGINEDKGINFNTAEEMFNELSTRQTGNITLTAKWTENKTELTDSFSFYNSVGQYIMYNSYSYSIYVGYQPTNPSDYVRRYDVSAKQDGSIDCKIVRDNYAHYSIYIYTTGNQTLVLPDNMNDYFQLAIPDIGQRVEQISFNGVSWEKVQEATRLFGPGYVHSIELIGDSTGFNAEGLFRDFSSNDVAITLGKGFSFNGYDTEIRGTFIEDGTGNVYVDEVPSKDGTYRMDNSFAVLDTGVKINRILSDWLNTKNVRRICFTNESSGGTIDELDISASQNGDVTATLSYDGGSMYWTVIDIRLNNSKSKLMLNSNSAHMFDSLYNPTHVDVVFGDIVYAPKDCNLMWHTSSDISYSGKDICGLVSHPNNKRSAISVKSEDSNILDITDAPVPEVENISQDTVEPESNISTQDALVEEPKSQDVVEPESDVPIPDALVEEPKKHEGGIENEG